MAVPCCCIKCSSLKTKLFIVRIILRRSQIDSVGTDLSVRWPRAILHALIPSLVGMFVYRDDTSRVTSMALLGRASMSLSLFNRWVVFFT